MNADSLSRLPCGGCDHCTKRDTQDKDKLVSDPKKGNNASDIHCGCDSKSDTDHDKCNWMDSKSPTEIATAQQTDHMIATIFSWLTVGQRPSWQEISHLGPELKTYWAKWSQLHLKDGVVYRSWTSDTKLEDRVDKLVLPKDYHDKVFKMLHEDPVCGHLSFTRTMKRFRNRFYWVGYKEDIRLWCSMCNQCQQGDNQQKKPKAPLKQCRAGAILERVALDILGPLPVTERGNRYILVIVDYFSRWTEAFALANIEAETVTRVFVEQFICRYGVPRQVHTDQGRQFESAVFQQVCEYLDVDKSRTTPGHPQSNGMVERFNRTLRAMLTKHVSGDQRDWDVKLPLVMLAYRSSEHESTGMSPSMMMFGREVELPVDLLFGKPPETDENNDNVARYVDGLKSKIGHVHELARVKMAKANEKTKERV